MRCRWKRRARAQLHHPRSCLPRACSVLTWLCCVGVFGLALSDTHADIPDDSEPSLTMQAVSWFPHTWPLVTVLFDVETELGHECLLDRELFTVYEDGIPHDIVDLFCGSESHNSSNEVALVIDISGSMGPYINAVRQQVQRYIDTLKVEAPGTRVGLLTYGSYLDKDGVVEFDLTTDYSKLRTWAETFEVSGALEPAWNATHRAIELLSWGTGTNKVIILVTDEPSNTDTITFEEVIARALDERFTIHVASRDYSPSTLNPDHDPTRLAEYTGGRWHDLGALDFVDFIPSIFASLRSAYRLTYITSRPCCTDFETRDVTVQVNEPIHGSLSDQLAYRPSCLGILNVTWVGHEPFSELPTVTIGAAVATLAGRNCELTEAHFEIYEGGEPRTITSLECMPGGLESKLDFVFVVDDSGSMANDFARVEDELHTFIDDMVQIKSDNRYSLVTVAVEPKILVNASQSPFEVLDYVRSLPLADDVEFTLDAISLALQNVTFRADARPVFVIITDEAADIGSTLMPNVAQALNARNAFVCVVSPAGLGGKLPILINETDLRALAEALDGLWIDFNNFDLHALARLIAFQLISQYVLTFESEQSLGSALSQDVGLRVVDPSGCVDADGMELQAARIFFVDQDHPGPSGPGDSWSTAFKELQPAIDAAAALAGNSEIWVKHGVYNELRNEHQGALVMRRGVKLFGGFQGHETNRHERDPLAHPTVIDGSAAWFGSPARHVVVGANRALLNGFFITGGMATGATSNQYGAGIFNDAESPRIENCVIYGNHARFGGGVYNRSSSAVLRNCVIVNNTAEFGAAIRNDNSSVTVVNCTIVNNSASVNGGGIYSSHSSTTILNSILWGNTPGSVLNSSVTSHAEVIHSIVEGGAYGIVDAVPAFANPAGLNYHLLPWSGGIDAGEPGKSTLSDIKGLARPQGAAPDLGAYEFRPNALPAPVITGTSASLFDDIYVSQQVLVHIEGAADAAAHMIVADGLHFGVLDQDESVSFWSYSGVLGPGLNTIRIAALNEAGEPSPATSIVIGNAVQPVYRLAMQVSTDDILVGEDVLVSGALEVDPASIESGLSGHAIETRLLSDGAYTAGPSVLLSAGLSFAYTWTPAEPGEFMIEVRFPGAPSLPASTWLSSGILVTVSSPPQTSSSDVNGDGVLDAVDIQLVINAALGLLVSPEVNADLNGDGVVDALDVQLIILAVLQGQ